MTTADGLLERTILLLSPRDARGWRSIRDSADGTPLGFCRRREADGWRWRLSRRVIEIHEQQDESLLCIVRRCWSFFAWYEVVDADGHLIGWHGDPMLLNRFGHRVGLREDKSDGRASWYIDPEGKMLAELAWQEEDVQLTFAEELAGEPLVKMLLLAAALRW